MCFLWHEGKKHWHEGKKHWHEGKKHWLCCIKVGGKSSLVLLSIKEEGEGLENGKFGVTEADE